MRADEVEQYRTLRLRALAGAPEAFGSLLADAAARSPEQWVEFVERFTGGAWSDLLVAASDDAFHSIAMVYIDEYDSSVAGLGHMWVDEERRGSGVAAALIAGAERWALDRSAPDRPLTVMRLWCTETNEAARRAYQRAGFLETGARQPLREGSPLQVLEMRKTIGPK